MTARIWASRVRPVRCASAIEAKVETCASPHALAVQRVERVDDRLRVVRRRVVRAMSPPSSARDCSRTLRCVLLANESIATSAATPSEIDDM